MVVPVFLLIMNQTEFCWIHNQMENCHYDQFESYHKYICLIIYIQQLQTYNQYIKMNF